MAVSRVMAGVLIIAVAGLCADVAFSEDNPAIILSQKVQLPRVPPDSQGVQIPQRAKLLTRTQQPLGRTPQCQITIVRPQAMSLSQGGRPSDEDALKSAGQSNEISAGAHSCQRQVTAPQTQPPSAASNQRRSSDLFAPVNHKVLNFNAEVDDKAFHPVASGWATVVPKPARQCIHRFFDNVAFVPRLTNAVFQLKLKDAGGELARFGINSTAGVAGLFDPADQWFGIKEHDNDFGKTLARWGMSGGWFVMMPVAGPINMRNVLGHFVDGAMDPMNYLVPGSAEIYEAVAHSIDGLNERAEKLDEFEGVSLHSDQRHPVALESSDLYETVRANFLQRENKKERRSAAAIAAATAGAAVAGAAAGGPGQAAAAAVGKAASEAAKVGQ